MISDSWDQIRFFLFLYPASCSCKSIQKKWSLWKLKPSLNSQYLNQFSIRSSNQGQRIPNSKVEYIGKVQTKMEMVWNCLKFGLLSIIVWILLLDSTYWKILNPFCLQIMRLMQVWTIMEYFLKLSLVWEKYIQKFSIGEIQLKNSDKIYKRSN